MARAPLSATLWVQNLLTIVPILTSFPECAAMLKRVNDRLRPRAKGYRESSKTQWAELAEWMDHEKALPVPIRGKNQAGLYDRQMLALSKTCLLIEAASHSGALMEAEGVLGGSPLPRKASGRVTLNDAAAFRKVTTVRDA